MHRNQVNLSDTSFEGSFSIGEPVIDGCIPIEGYADSPSDNIAVLGAIQESPQSQSRSWDDIYPRMSFETSKIFSFDSDPTTQPLPEDLSRGDQTDISKRLRNLAKEDRKKTKLHNMAYVVISNTDLA